MFKKETDKNYKVDSKSWEEIHVMPHIDDIKKSGVSLKKISVSVVVLIIVITAVAGIFFLLESKKFFRQNNNSNTGNIGLNTNTDKNINVGTNVNTDSNANLNANANTNINTNADLNNNANSNKEIKPPVLAGQLPPGKDFDNDGLTDMEEEVYDTSYSRKDTDGDGYGDKEEILNGYSPTLPDGTLNGSAVVADYSNSEFNYGILYPAKFIWTETSQKRLVIFDTRMGSSIAVMVRNNSLKLGPSEYFSALFPDKKDKFSLTKINNFDVIKDEDGLVYYLFSSDVPDSVYVIEYRPGSRNSLDYLVSFELMAKNFVLK